MKRSDVHSPSKIVPSDYEFVCYKYIGKLSSDVELDTADEMKRFTDHMDRTGGKFSKHEHKGNCGCCGASANYYSIFYHALSNSYIKIGYICAEKLNLSTDGASNLFKKNVQAGLKARAGKRKAQAVLNELNLLPAWDIYQSKELPKYEERIIQDMVGNLVKFGDFKSEKQIDFLKALLQKITDRPAIEAAKELERQNATDCPSGKQKIVGTVLSSKHQDGYYGSTLKMLVQSEQGFKVWGTVPEMLISKIVNSNFGSQFVLVGTKIEFIANITPSDKDNKFGFFKRPSKVTII